MSLLLQESAVYGPLQSRRFGKSLGINLLPATAKVCNFNCVYCQYGKTSERVRAAFPTVSDVESELADFFEGNQSLALDWIMIAGNGEPTLHPEFAQAVQTIISLRNRYRSRLPVGILSNASTCDRPEVRKMLSKLDGRFMKLDAGGLGMFWTINQPLPSVNLKKIIQGLSQMKKVVLQSLFVTGKMDNTREESMKEWVRAVELIRPEAVQVYSIDRDPRVEGLLPVPRETLEAIAGMLTIQTGVPAFIF